MPILKTDEITNNLTHKKAPSHSEGAINKVLPFATTKKYVKGSFQPLLGDYVRNITQIKPKKQKTSSLDALGVDPLVYSIEKVLTRRVSSSTNLKTFCNIICMGKRKILS